MSALREHLRDYLELRRGLGFKLERAGQLLAGLVSYLEAAARRRSPSSMPWPGRPPRRARTRAGGGCG